MLGNYDPKSFEGVELEPFGIFLQSMFYAIVALLILNMLIAAMGESYAAVSQKGAAQFRYEQAQLIIEQRCLKSSVELPEHERLEN